MYIGSRLGDRSTVWGHAGFIRHSASAPSEDRLTADGCQRPLGIPAAVAQDLLTRNPSVAGALWITCNGGNPREPGDFRQSALCEGRSPGIAGEASGFKGRSVFVVADDGRAWVSGLRSIAPPSDTASNSRGRAADVGNRADRRENGSPGRALPLSVLRSEKSCGAFVSAGIALMIAVG